MPTIRYNDTESDIQKGHVSGFTNVSVSNITDELKKDITRIDQTIAETMKPLELVVEEQSKTINKLTETNTSLEYSNSRLSATLEMSHKNVQDVMTVMTELELKQKHIELLKSKLNLCLIYSAIASILILAETIFLLI